MKRVNFSLVDRQLRLDDYPGAAKVVAVPGHPAQHLADLQLHMRDLEQVQDWEATLKRVTSELDPAPGFTIRRGLWYAMVVRFCKCFDGSNGRFHLDPKAVYRGDTAALEDYRYFSDLRDKNLVHDENKMWQAYTVAVLNPPGLQPKVADVLCLSILEQAFNTADIAKFEPLVGRAAQWVHEKFDKRSARLKDDLEKFAYERLNAFDTAIPYVLPDERDASSPKPRFRRTDAQAASGKREKGRRS